MKQKKAQKLARKGQRIQQVAVLPFRRDTSGTLQVLLMTSRQSRRFVVPKGWPMKGRPDHKAAALEAKQEAGLVGDAQPKPFGVYEYWKRLASSFVHVSVSVYPFEVVDEKRTWREQATREKRWLRPEEAALLVDEPELAVLIERFAANFEHAPA